MYFCFTSRVHVMSTTMITNKCNRPKHRISSQALLSISIYERVWESSHDLTGPGWKISIPNPNLIRLKTWLDGWFGESGKKKNQCIQHICNSKPHLRNKLKWLVLFTVENYSKINFLLKSHSKIASSDHISIKIRIGFHPLCNGVRFLIL